jgi:hypothetical protein
VPLSAQAFQWLRQNATLCSASFMPHSRLKNREFSSIHNSREGVFTGRLRKSEFERRQYALLALMSLYEDDSPRSATPASTFTQG